MDRQGLDIVDAHHHLWDRGRFRYSWLREVSAIDQDYLLPDYEAAIEATGVRRSVHVQADVDPAFALQETNWILSLADAGGPVEAAVGWAPVDAGDDLERFLDDLGEHPRLKGFRRLIQGEADDFAARPKVVDGVRRLGARGYSFDLCVFHPQLAAVVELARQCPDTPLVLDHIGKPGIKDGRLDPWRQQVRELARCEHVCCKLSGMTTEADWNGWSVEDLRPYAETILEAFGSDRVMFGSDWPVATLAVGYERWLQVVEELTAGLDDAERTDLMHDTAVRFYRLD